MSSRINLYFILLIITKLIWALTNEEKKLLLEKHNHLRSQVSPPAADMLKMSWDTELESFAKNYAAKCIWDHNADNEDKGENLYAATTPTLDVQRAVQDWYDEQLHYSFDNNNCTENEFCGHYTQVVWASSEKIGCGEHFCEKLEGLNSPNWYLLVCNYSPVGNMEGSKPYRYGMPCEHCPDGYQCASALCKETSSQISKIVVPTDSQSPETTSNQASWPEVPTTSQSPETTSRRVSRTEVPIDSESAETTSTQVFWVEVPTDSESPDLLEEKYINSVSGREQVLESPAVQLLCCHFILLLTLLMLLQFI